MADKLSEKLRGYAESNRDGFEDSTADDWADEAHKLERELTLLQIAHRIVKEELAAARAVSDTRAAELKRLHKAQQGVVEKRAQYWEKVAYDVQDERDILAGKLYKLTEGQVNE